MKEVGSLSCQTAVVTCEGRETCADTWVSLRLTDGTRAIGWSYRGLGVLAEKEGEERNKRERGEKMDGMRE